MRLSKDELNRVLSNLYDYHEDAELLRNHIASLEQEMREGISKFEEVLMEAQAAMWDAHYGCGISVLYVQSVDAKIRAALGGDDKQDTRSEPDSRDFEYEVLVEFYQKALVSIEELEQEVGRLRKQLNLAVAHDCQPYPTAWAYEQLAAAHETLRTQNDALRDALIWCSGSNDFGPGGIAEKGFISKVRPLLADSKIANVARYKAFKRFMKEEWSE